MGIKDRLKLLLTELDLTANGMATVMKYKRSDTIKNAENGTNYPGYELSRDIVTKFNVNANWWFTGQGKMFNEGGKQTKPNESGLSLNDRVDELYALYEALDNLTQEIFEKAGTAHDRIDSLVKDESADDSK